MTSSEHASELETLEYRRSFDQDGDEDMLGCGSSLGRYRLTRHIGHGASGDVFEAHDPVLDRAVALKVLRGRWTPAASLRLQREAHALARLSHPNVVQIYEIGVDRGYVFIAMELVRGRTLGRWQQGAPSWRESVAVYLQAAAGLAAAHEAGIVHRDFKPHNCILGDDGRVRVLDFGLARDPGGTGSAATAASASASDLDGPLTVTGAVMGTVAYMPLEQLEGRPATAASDQFSLCVSLHQALYGHRPFVGDDADQLTESLRSMTLRPVEDGRIPAALRKVLLRGLQPDPADRWPSVQSLIARLRAVERPRAKRWVLWGGVSVAMLGAAGAWAWLARPPSPVLAAAAGDPETIAIDDLSPSPVAQQLRWQAEGAWAADDPDELQRALDRFAPGSDLPDDPSLAAEVLLWRGKLLDDRDPEALETFRRAFFVAREADVPSTAARAALAATSVIVAEHGPAFDEWMRHAWEELHRGPWDRSAAVEVLVSASYGRAVVYGDEQAMDLLDLASATIGEPEPSDGPFMASSMVELASAWRFVDEPERGLHWARRATELIEATAGPDHPVHSAAQAEVGRCINELGPCYLGLPHLERARVAQLASSGGAIDWRSAIIAEHIAECLEELRRYDAALQEYQRVAAYWAEQGDEYRSRELGVRISIARLLEYLGRVGEAEQEYERAIAFVDPNGPENPTREMAREELEELRAHQGGGGAP